MKDKKLLIYTVAMVVSVAVFMIIALIIIWSPKKNKNDIQEEREKVYKYVENTNYQNKTFNLYKGEVDRLLMPVNYLQLYEVTNEDFLKSNNLTKDNFKAFLEENQLLGNEIKFRNFVVIIKGDTYIYRVTYDVVNSYDYTQVLAKDRIVNIIEEKPYSYTLSFEKGSLDILKNNVVATHDNITFNIKNIENKENSVKYEIRFTNNNEENVNIDFDDINNILLGLKNGRKIRMAATVISADEEILNKGASLRKEAFFSVTLEEQGLIDYIEFAKVTIGDEVKSIKVKF